jgi:hypothetical protein
MKKLLTGALIGAILSASIPTMAETVDVAFNKIKVIVNGQTITEPNVLIDGKTYVPLRAISESLNMNVAWDGATSTATISKPTPTPRPTPTPLPEKNTLDTKEGFTIKFLQRIDHPVHHTYLVELKNYSNSNINYDMTKLASPYGQNALLVNDTEYNLINSGTLSPGGTLQGYVSVIKNDRATRNPSFSYNDQWVTMVK